MVGGEKVLYLCFPYLYSLVCLFNFKFDKYIYIYNIDCGGHVRTFLVMQFTKVHASIALTQLLPLQKRKKKEKKREKPQMCMRFTCMIFEILV
jgi:hypothetical protein